MKPLANKGVVSPVLSSAGVSEKPAYDYYFTFQLSFLTCGIEFVLFLLPLE